MGDCYRGIQIEHSGQATAGGRQPICPTTTRESSSTQQAAGGVPQQPEQTSSSADWQQQLQQGAAAGAHVSPGPWMTSIGLGPAQSAACVRGHTCVNQLAASRSTPGGLRRSRGVPGGNSTHRLCPAGRQAHWQQQQPD